MDADKGFYNGEEVMMELNGFIYTVSEGSDTVTIKCYTEEGKLIEEVTTLPNNEGIESRTYNTLEINTLETDSVEKVVILREEAEVNLRYEGNDPNLEFDNIEIEDFNDITLLNGSNTLGRSVFTSKTAPYTRAMTVTYTSTSKGGQTYRVPNTLDTMTKLTGYLLTIASWKIGIVKTLVDNWVLNKIVEVVGEKVIFSQFNVAANETQIQYWGVDNYGSIPYTGSIVGTNYYVITEGSKYYGRDYQEGIFVSPTEWGNGTLTRVLAPSVYGGFLSNLTYQSEGK